ncbi:MAG: hypothetical protein B6U87_00480 [Candidatus Aenigmarchaeota archaeon ex4484_52]|nr:MAG: hypothetical protein B6U87_00480 [Candidatus Aenigmarchaeota archaeon ex4484_52]
MQQKYLISETIKISPKRIGNLIGKQGVFKKNLEEKLNAKLTINSKEGTILCLLNDYDAYQKLNNIIIAISRGFSNKDVFLLLKPDFICSIIKLGNNKKTNIRQKSRIIGEKGKIKKSLERLCSVKISIYGKTICLIGKNKDMFLCQSAINNLLKGVKHNIALEILKKRKQEEKHNQENQ